MLALIDKYFPEFSPTQRQQMAALQPLYQEWNEKINVISRKDMDNFYIHHVLHSLAIAKYIQFLPNTEIVDVGTGGGFPGIPLAIAFPEVRFHLVDSIGKKIKVVQGVADALELKNVTSQQIRAEELTHQYDFVVSRAVTEVSNIYFWMRKKLKTEDKHSLTNGLILLKGGDLTEEFANFKYHHRFTPISSYFEEEFFETKKIVYVKM